MRIFITLIIILTSFSIVAQENSADTLQADTLAEKNFKYLPTGVRIGTDLIALGKSQFTPGFSGWEFSGDLDFNRYLLTFDYGHGSRTYDTDSSDYSNDGTFWRVGVDVNFLTKDVDRNAFFVGMRYGHATFNEDLAIILEADDIWQNGQLISYTNRSVNARWFELTTGLKVKLWQFIWMGYTARFKVGLKTSGDLNMIPHDVPGYGKTFKNSYWGFNYYLFVRLPFRKSFPIEAKNKKKK